MYIFLFLETLYPGLDRTSNSWETPQWSFAEGSNATFPVLPLKWNVGVLIYDVMLGYRLTSGE